MFLYDLTYAVHTIGFWMCDCFCLRMACQVFLSSDSLVASVTDWSCLVVQSAFTQSSHVLGGLPRGLSPWMFPFSTMEGYLSGCILLMWPKYLSRLVVTLLMTVSWAPRVSLMMVLRTLSSLVIPKIFLRQIISIVSNRILYDMLMYMVLDPLVGFGGP